MNNLSFGDLYEKWIIEFLLNKGTQSVVVGSDIWNKNVLLNSSGIMTTNEENNYKFVHGNHNRYATNKTRIILYNNDGIYKRFQDGYNSIKNLLNKALLSELFEIIATKIEIYDNRIFIRAKDLTHELGEVNVWAYEETELKYGEKRHFGIVHLSFIEELTGKKGSEAVKIFFKDKKDICDRFAYLVIISGRGRDWFTDLKSAAEKKECESLNMQDINKIRFGPIENYLNCFDEGKKLNSKGPEAGIKYALVKTIFGS